MSLHIKIIFVLIILNSPISGFASDLSIHVVPPSSYKIAMLNNHSDVFLEGEIDKQAAVRVKNVLTKLGDSTPNIYLDSPGGNLLAGMELGKVLRLASAHTNIGKLVNGQIKSGACMSSCSLAFLGGVYRFIASGSVFGVHRISTTLAPTSNDLDTGQILSAAISNYIRDMDVDPALFDRMVQAGKNEIYVLTPAETKALEVVNDGRKPSQWSIEANKDVQYLKGVQYTMHGMGKAIFYCIKGNLIFHSIYEAGPNASALATGSWEHSMLVDHKQLLPLSKPDSILNDNGYINAQFLLNKKQIGSFYIANSIGHSMQSTRESPTFLGYEVDIDEPSSKRIRGFIDNCNYQDH